MARPCRLQKLSPERNLDTVYIGHCVRRIHSRGFSDHQGIPSSQAPRRQVEVEWTIDHADHSFHLSRLGSHKKSLFYGCTEGHQREAEYNQ